MDDAGKMRKQTEALHKAHTLRLPQRRVMGLLTISSVTSSRTSTAPTLIAGDVNANRFTDACGENLDSESGKCPIRRRTADDRPLAWDSDVSGRLDDGFNLALLVGAVDDLQISYIFNAG